MSKGEGSFRPRRDYTRGHFADSVAIGDLNGDGNSDLVTANVDASGNVSVLVNRGE